MLDIQKFAMALFRLPDDRIVLQRRTQDAPYGAGLLGPFGGWVEANETVEACLVRELAEETSLSIKDLQPKFIMDVVMKSSEDFSEDRHFYVYEIPINNASFAVYEGDGTEAYTLNELKNRSDLTGAAQFVFSTYTLSNLG